MMRSTSQLAWMKCVSTDRFTVPCTRRCGWRWMERHVASNGWIFFGCLRVWEILGIPPNDQFERGTLLWKYEPSRIRLPDFRTKPFETFAEEGAARDTAMSFASCWWRSHAISLHKVPIVILCKLGHLMMSCCHLHIRAFTPTKQCSLVRWMIEESPYMTLCCLSAKNVDSVDSTSPPGGHHLYLLSFSGAQLVTCRFCFNVFVCYQSHGHNMTEPFLHRPEWFQHVPKTKKTPDFIPYESMVSGFWEGIHLGKPTRRWWLGAGTTPLDSPHWIQDQLFTNYI